MLLMAAFSGAAQGLDISGKVLEAGSGQPVPGAIVRLDDNYLWAITDEDGEFELEGVQKGTYVLEASCLGYVTYSREIKVKGDIENLVIRISENTLALQEVVVTAETSKDNLNTTQKIGRTALDHLQMSGVDGRGALLPGGKTLNPDLTTDNALSLRAAGSDAGNAAFSTAVEVNVLLTLCRTCGFCGAPSPSHFSNTTLPCCSTITLCMFTSFFSTACRYFSMAFRSLSEGLLRFSERPLPGFCTVADAAVVASTVCCA